MNSFNDVLVETFDSQLNEVKQCIKNFEKTVIRKLIF